MPITGEHNKVVEFIRLSHLADRFDVLINLEEEKHYISQMFPDIILVDKQTKLPAFILEVKKNGQVAKCMQQWKSVSNIPATLYIIVPIDELQNAKSIAGVVGLQTRFGAYKTDLDGNVVSVTYE